MTRTRRAGVRAAPGGFSFVEILIAVAILGTGLIMVAMLFPVAADQQRRAMQESTARDVADSAFRVLEQNLRPNYFTYPQSGTPINPADFSNQGANPPLRNAEFDAWPVGVWATDFQYKTPNTYAPYTASDPAVDFAKNFWVYVPLRGDNPGITGRPELASFALDRRVTSQMRVYPADASPTTAEYLWDYALRMDRSGAMHAIVYVWRRPASDYRFLDPYDRTPAKRTDVPSLATAVNMTYGQSATSNVFTFTTAQESGTGAANALISRRMTSAGDLWLVDREGAAGSTTIPSGFGAGNIYRINGWNKAVGPSGGPAFAGGWTENLAGRRMLMTRIRTDLASDFDAIDAPGELDPTVAVYSSVLKFN